MWQLLEQKMIQVNKAAGIEITFLADGKLLFNSVIAYNKKNAITRENEITVDDLSELTRKLDAHTPVSLVFNGKGVLVRKLPATTTDNPAGLILPNANPTDFFYEVYQQDDTAIAAVARTDAIEKIITAFKNAGFKVLQVSLGFACIDNVLSFFNTGKHNTVVTNSFILKWNQLKKIDRFETNESVTTDRFKMEEYAIGDQYVRSSHLLAFAAAINLLADNLKDPPVIALTSVTQERSEFRYLKLFRAAAMALLAGLFFILLVNFLIYSHYFNKNKELATSQLFSREKLHQATLLEENIGKKEKFLQQSGWFKPGRVSFYADRIASLTPSNTLLTGMAIYPLKTNASSIFPAMNFKTDTIQVTGSCNNPVEINQFINNLKILHEFRYVSLKNYTYKKERETAVFSLEIVTR